MRASERASHLILESLFEVSEESDRLVLLVLGVLNGGAFQEVVQLRHQNGGRDFLVHGRLRAYGDRQTKRYPETGRVSLGHCRKCIQTPGGSNPRPDDGANLVRPLHVSCKSSSTLTLPGLDFISFRGYQSLLLKKQQLSTGVRFENCGKNARRRWRTHASVRSLAINRVADEQMRVSMDKPIWTREFGDPVRGAARPNPRLRAFRTARWWRRTGALCKIDWCPRACVRACVVPIQVCTLYDGVRLVWRTM